MIANHKIMRYFFEISIPFSGRKFPDLTGSGNKSGLRVEVEAELDDDRVTSCPEKLSFPERSGKPDKTPASFSSGGRVEFQEELAFKLESSVFKALLREDAHLKLKVKIKISFMNVFALFKFPCWNSSFC